MRDIVFRGKDENGKWAYGSLLMRSKEDCEILQVQKYEGIESDNWGWSKIDYETIGQYTGIKDKNGKMIFEGDIVKVNGVANAEISYDEDSAKFTFFWGTDGMPICVINSNERSMEVVGNIYENRDLL